jgi:hypothetical protein
VTVSSPTPRRVRAPSWRDPRLVAGIVLVLGSVLLGAKIISGANHSYRMLAVSHDLAAGTMLTARDVTIVRVHLTDRGRGVYASDDGDVVGKQLNRALASGELIPASALAKPAALTTVTIPLAVDAAPRISPGQRIEVWLSTKLCPSAVELADVTVQDVHDSGGGSFSSAGGQNVVVSVAPDLAGRVVDALAQDGAVVRAGVLSGPRQEDANDALPQLADCGAPGP